jgi:hypothetical protein
MVLLGYQNLATRVGAFLLPAILVSGVPLATRAEDANVTLYKVTDKDGNVTFTDSPPSDATDLVEPYTLPSTNSSMPTTLTTPDTESEREDASPNYRTEITLPENGTTIPMGPGNFTVAVNLDPALNAEETLILEVDGQPSAPPQRHGSWNLTNVFRGEHQLRVLRIDASGLVAHQSDVTTVFVLRPSVKL